MSENKFDFTKAASPMLAVDDLFWNTVSANFTPRYSKSVVDELVKEARKAGREEAWDLAQRIMLDSWVKGDSYEPREIHKVFDTVLCSDALAMPVKEALEKDQAYQKEKEEAYQKEKEEANKLHIGDEVTYTCGGDTPGKGFVAHISDDESEVRILMNSSNSNGMSIRFTSADRCKKTGKHSPDVVKILEALKQ